MSTNVLHSDQSQKYLIVYAIYIKNNFQNNYSVKGIDKYAAI